MKPQDDSRFWLDIEVNRILQTYPEGEIVVSSGISPSASYHIGHYPEVLMAEALAWGLRRAGRPVRHIHVVDNMDPLRKRYEFLPEAYEQYVGWPICLIPSPDGKGSYADHFFSQFERYFKIMGINPDQIVRSYEDLYCSGQMAPQIEKVLENLKEIKGIFAEFGRELARDWTPIQVKKADNRFVNARPDTWDPKAHTIEGVSYLDGGVKLNWRLDWPARWQLLGVMVEPFNAHEHGAAGGSYDTGKAFAERIFDYPAPLSSAKYGNVHLGDDKVKMSSSKGNLLTPEQALKIIPPSVLRYFVVRSKPPKSLRFYTDKKLINLIDEYKQVSDAVINNQDHDFADAYRFADIGDKLTNVPFAHLVSVYQAALGDSTQTAAILARTGYDVELEVLESELSYVQNWLEYYAPDSVKFSLKKTLPKDKLSQDQTDFLADLADKIEDQDRLEAQWVHDAVYELKDKHNLKPNEAFSAIYTVLLGQSWGPKVGWFLTTIDKYWLTKRLKLEE